MRHANSTSFRKGQPKTGGRKKGTPNRATALLRDAILRAAELAGDQLPGKQGMVGYLVNLAKTNSSAFSSLLGKVLPTQVEGTAEDGKVVVEIVRFGATRD